MAQVNEFRTVGSIGEALFFAGKSTEMCYSTMLKYALQKTEGITNGMPRSFGSKTKYIVKGEEVTIKINISGMSK